MNMDANEIRNAIETGKVEQALRETSSKTKRARADLIKLIRAQALCDACAAALAEAEKRAVFEASEMVGKTIHEAAHGVWVRGQYDYENAQWTSEDGGQQSGMGTAYVSSYARTLEALSRIVRTYPTALAASWVKVQRPLCQKPTCGCYETPLQRWRREEQARDDAEFTAGIERDIARGTV